MPSSVPVAECALHHLAGGENSGHLHMSPLKHQDFFDTDHVYTWHIYQDKVSMRREAQVQRPPAWQ